jgi:predicted nucleotidyltransferase
MNFDSVISTLRDRLPGMIAVYGFGSRVRDGGAQARTDSDLDLAVLVGGYADRVGLFDLAGDLSDLTGCPVDLLDLRAASSVMQQQILMTGERLWTNDPLQADLVEAAMLSEKLHLDEKRRPMMEEALARGHIDGR